MYNSKKVILKAAKIVFMTYNVQFVITSGPRLCYSCRKSNINQTWCQCWVCQIKNLFAEKKTFGGNFADLNFFLAKPSCGAKTKTSVNIQTAVRSDRVLLMCLQNPKESRLISVYFIIRSTGLQNRCAYKDELLLPESKQESSTEDLEEHRTAIQLSTT